MLFWNSGTWLRGVAAFALLFANPVARAEPPLATTKQTKADPGANLKRSDNRSAETPAAAPNSDAVVRRRREAIALMLESNRDFGIAYQVPPKITNAKFAGPFEYKGLLQTKSSTIYCASARIDFPIIPGEYVAVMAIVPTADGKEKVVGRIGLTYVPTQCLRAPYGPFPELERARQKRREALGQTD
jgi:hypothetical protein